LHENNNNNNKQADCEYENFGDENLTNERPRKKLKSTKKSQANVAASSSSSFSNQFSSPVSSLSPANSTSPSNSNRSNDDNASSAGGNNNNFGGGGGGGGGICSVLLEVIEKLRDAESSSSFSSSSSTASSSSSSSISASNQIIDVSNTTSELLSSAKKLKNKKAAVAVASSTDLKKRKKNPSQLINIILSNHSKKNDCNRHDDDEEANDDINAAAIDARNKLEHEQRVNGVKKQRKKRISKKLNQLIAMNCGSGIVGCVSSGLTSNNQNNFIPIINDGVKEAKSNKISMIIESQQKYLQKNTINNNSSNNDNTISEQYVNLLIVSQSPEESATLKVPIHSGVQVCATPNGGDSMLVNEECTIETSIVNSLYDDGVSILNSLDSNLAENGIQDQVNEQHKLSNLKTNINNHDNNNSSSTKGGDDDVDFNFSYKNHNGVLLNDLNIKLIENSDDKEECNKRSFLCFKCSLFFSDLLALCEHKSNCEKSFDQLTTVSSSSHKSSDAALATTSSQSGDNKIKYYLCDLCHSKDPLNTVMSETSRAKISNTGYSKAINSYYLLNISDKKFYFKCFGDLDAINEHFKVEHQQHLSSKTNGFTSSCKQEEKNEPSLTQDNQALFSASEHQIASSGSINIQLKNSTSSDANNSTYNIISTTQCIEIKNLLESLATNDGGEQYILILYY